MKPEVAERILIEELFDRSIENGQVSSKEIKNVDRLTGDASTRRYYRLETEMESYVICLDNPTTEKDGKNNFIETQRFFKENKIRVPIIHDMLLNKGYILEEDLGDITLLQKLSSLRTTDCEYKMYERVIDELIKIHKIDPKKTKDSHLFNLAFDYEKLTFEIDFTIKYFLNLFLGLESQKLKEDILLEFRPICERLASQKMVLTHRDFHSRNIMWKKSDELVVIDFQDARMGIPQYDLVSILEDSYYEIDYLNKIKLKEYYFEKMGEDLLSQTKDEFESYYADMAIQRVFKAIGSFTYIFHTRKDFRYLKYIGFAMEKLKTIMLRDEKYFKLKYLLFKNYYES